MLMAKASQTGYQVGNHRPFHGDREVERERGTNSPVHLDECAGCHELDGDSRSDIVRTCLAYWLYLRDSRCAQ